MSNSYRIRTELGINKTINVQLDQEFEFLEILSLKIQQEDVYIRACADYGVVVGRVTANNGFGLPNARVSVFIPIDSIDESNPIITSIYPYKSPTDKNEDGYRYNLLPYEKSYSKHAATGTLPTRLDALTGQTSVQIYDKYYRFTAKTNESGDYMIMGVPLGFQTIFMDVDLSDIGEFSLTPQDLIRVGRATEAQVAGNKFRISTDLNSLPQIVSLTKSLEVSPLWGEPQVCDIAINRVDFDLRDDVSINIEPTAVFMGSIYSTSDAFRVRKNARPRDNMGNLCALESGPGQILSIRQTIRQDSNGNPILEQYELEQAGNIIDGNGVWLTEVPMNLDYVITNEFGEKVLSNDPTVGIPTKGRYRFKIKWAQSPSLTEQVRRPYYLVPNIREYGWHNVSSDPNMDVNLLPKYKKELAGSYYFGLDWTGYTNTQAAIDCEDTFYEFYFNKVYTVSGLIDEFKNGGRGRFIGVKEIDSNECASTTNKFPVNEGFRNFDLLYFIFSIIFQVIQIIGLPLLIVYHILAFLWNNFAVLILGYLIYQFTVSAVEYWSLFGGAVAGSAAFGATVGLIAGFLGLALLYTGLVTVLLLKFKDIVSYKFSRFKLPMITYPDCQACECIPEGIKPSDEVSAIPVSGLPAQLSNPGLYSENITTYYEKNNTDVANEDFDTINSNDGLIASQAIAGLSSPTKNPEIFKTPTSQSITYPNNSKKLAFSYELPPGERINVYNLRTKYFGTTDANRIKVSFASNINQSYHYDSTLTILSSYDVASGDLLTFINSTLSTDSNYLWTGSTTVGGNTLKGIMGKLNINQQNIIVNYADPNDRSGITSLQSNYTIPSGNTPTYVSSIDIDVTLSGTVEYRNSENVKIFKAIDIGNTTLSDVNCIELSSLNGTADFTIKKYGDACQRYVYPSDIEYYQVLTAITITSTIVNGKVGYNNPNFSGDKGFWGALNNGPNGNTIVIHDGVKGGWSLNSKTQSFPTSEFSDFKEQKVLILQRGVDPYSPLVTNKYSVGKILGYANEDDVVFTANTRLNIPIQSLPPTNTTSVQNHSNQDNIFYGSNFFTAGNKFSAYTTSNVGFYGALDSNTSYVTNRIKSYKSTTYVNPFNITAVMKGVISRPNPTNRFCSLTANLEAKYDLGEDLSGGAILFGNTPTTSSNCDGFINCAIGNYYYFIPTPTAVYFSPILYPQFISTPPSFGTPIPNAGPLSITNSSKTIMRTDRLPSSDYIDDKGNIYGSVSLLQQNLGFATYNLTSGQSSGELSFGTGASQVTADIGGQLAEANVLESLNTCENMVGLNCYSGNSVNFGVKKDCSKSDSIENGCYILMNRPLIDLFNGKDLGAFAEWGFRFRFFYGLCRGVLSQSFANNWVNGSLYTFPIQVDTFFDNKNQPLPPEFAKEIVYFDEKTNNFYYRSSPYYSGRTSSSPFIGRPTTNLVGSVNKRNLLFPTTIINLGIKDSFYQEIIFDPSAKGYIMNSLNPSSYSDTSDLVNLFVISRITDEGFLSQIISINGLNQLFTRNGSNPIYNPLNRVDADLAQAMSINSEYGVIPFSPEFYSVRGVSTDPVVILGNLNSPTMGVFFSSTTENLQNKDYITPGIIDFRPNYNANAITYPYGIKTQEVPFYKWKLNQGVPPSIFGSDKNNWATSTSDIFSYGYQSLNRRTIPPNNEYFIGSNTQISDLYERGYIFNIDFCVNGITTGNYSYVDCSGISVVGNGSGKIVKFSLSRPSSGVNQIPNQTSELIYSYNSGIPTSPFMVGAPFHFYFGVIKGETALDKFKTKYSVDE
jgi:hypothetical protein